MTIRLSDHFVEKKEGYIYIYPVSITKQIEDYSVKTGPHSIGAALDIINQTCYLYNNITSLKKQNQTIIKDFSEYLKSTFESLNMIEKTIENSNDFARDYITENLKERLQEKIELLQHQLDKHVI